MFSDKSLKNWYLLLSPAFDRALVRCLPTRRMHALRVQPLEASMQIANTQGRIA
jgi:hypothetical protein